MTRPSLARWQPAAIGAAVASVSVLLAAMVVELALTFADYPPAYGNHQRLFVEYDSIRGWRNIAGGGGRLVTPDFTVDLEYNARSYRGPLPAYEKPPGTYRVVLVGDSYLEGYMVALDDRLAEVAERMLNDGTATPTVDVIALGTAGYSTDQELLWLESEGLRYQPDLVVLLFVTNDIWFNATAEYPRGPKPMFVPAGDSLVLTNVPVPRLDPDTATEPTNAPISVLGRLKTLLKENSRIARLADRAVDRSPWLRSMAARLGLLEVPVATVETRDGAVTLPAEFSVFADSLTPEARHALEVTTLLVADMGRRSAEAGAAFTAVLVPANDAVYPPGARQSARFSRVSPIGGEQRPSERFGDICRGARVRCVDPTDVFVAAAESLAAHNELLIVPDDGHWNQHGHRVAAGVIADIVREEMASAGGR